MIDGVMQCCYTNAVKNDFVNGRDSGWQTVAVSENIPSKAYKYCENLQVSHSTIQGVMLDENGAALNLLEFCSDGKYLYVMRSLYGLLGSGGRANMFSHAYIIPWQQENVLDDPNSFLAISNENFKDNEEAALQKQESLILLPKFTIKSAMLMAGIDVDLYSVLIKCVYMQISENRQGEPLYIKYDGSEMQLRAILFCIYYGLPYFLRKKLSSSSAATPNNLNRNIIFCRTTEEKQYYLDLQTGKNNILTERAERKIERRGFVDYVAKNINKVSSIGYWKKLETEALRLGDSNDEIIVKIAHYMLSGSDIIRYNDNEIKERLNEALNSRSYNSQLMCSYIANMLDEMVKRELVLSNFGEAILNEWLAEAGIAYKLRISGQNYNIYILSKLTREDALIKLQQLSETELKVYQLELAKLDWGQEILDDFRLKNTLDKSLLSWEVLIDCLDSVQAKDQEKIRTKAWQFYQESLAKRIEDFQDDYKKYVFIMDKIIGKPFIKNQFGTKKTVEHFTMLLSLSELTSSMAQMTEIDFAEEIKKFLCEHSAEKETEEIILFKEWVAQIIEQHEVWNKSKLLELLNVSPEKTTKEYSLLESPSIKLRDAVEKADKYKKTEQITSSGKSRSWLKKLF